MKYTLYDANEVSHGTFDSLDEARGAVAYDGLYKTGFSIWAESGNGLSHRIAEEAGR